MKTTSLLIQCCFIIVQIVLLSVLIVPIGVLAAVSVLLRRCWACIS